MSHTAYLPNQVSAGKMAACARIVQRGFATLSRANVAGEQRKYQDDVHLLNYRPPPSHTFLEALAVLRAFAISHLDETVELHLKVDMGLKKVGIDFNPNSNLDTILSES